MYNFNICCPDTKFNLTSDIKYLDIHATGLHVLNLSTANIAGKFGSISYGFYLRMTLISSKFPFSSVSMGCEVKRSVRLEKCCIVSFPHCRVRFILYQYPLKSLYSFYSRTTQKFVVVPNFILFAGATSSGRSKLESHTCTVLISHFSSVF